MSATATAPHKSRRSRQVGVKAALLALVAVALLPYLYMLITSLKSNQQYADDSLGLTFPIHLENYATAWLQIAPYLGNTALVAVVSLVLVLVIASIGGFVLARYRFRGRTLIFGSIVALMMVPGIANLIPLFVMMRDLSLLNSYVALAIPYTAGGVVLGTVLIRNFADQIPQSLFDAARLDGANSTRMYRSVMLPLSLPVLGTIGILTLITVWNDFFWPLLVISDNGLRTVSVGLQFFQGQNAIDYGPLMAGYLIASLPLIAVFAFASKYFLAGVQGGVPGAH